MIRRWSHSGSVNAWGLSIDPRTVGLGQARQRAFTEYCAVDGARLCRHRDAWIVMWPAPRRLEAELAVGEPLTRVDGALTAVPLTPSEWQMLQTAHGLAGPASNAAPTYLVAAEAGSVDAVPISDLQTEDPSTWIDVTAWTCDDADTLAAPDPIAPPQPVADVDARARLGVPRASAEQDAMLRRLAGTGRDAAPDVGGKGLGIWTHIKHWWRGSPRRLAGRTAATLDTPSRRPSRLRAVLARCTRWLARSPLGALIGRSQARYLMQLERLFSRGDIDEALRRALPTTPRIGGDAQRVMLGTPGRRSSIEFRIGPDLGVGPAFGLGADWFSQLRATYRKTVARLVARGHIDKAAFVLLDLLDDPIECVELLVKHDRATLAAELADVRGLESGLVVRLWFLAKQPKRAVATAKRTGAFADAITRLEAGGHTDEAASLRMLWADAAAEAGDYATAVNVAWNVTAAGRLVDDWMRRGIEAGGPAGAALLGRSMQRVVDGDDDAAASRLASVARIVEYDRGHAERLALGRALVEFPSVPGRRTAGTVVRGMLADLSAHPRVDVLNAVRALARYEGGVVRADLPVLRIDAQARVDTPTELEIPAGDIGSLPILDAVPLPNGRALVALGELGVGLINRTGALVHMFNCPCDELVLSDSGGRALALRRRKRLTAVSRINVDARRAAAWADLELLAHAPTFDGVQWFVSAPGELLALDMQSDAPRSLWRVGDLSCASIVRDERWLRGLVVAEQADEGEQFAYEMPGSTLRVREPLSLEPGHVIAAMAADGRRATIQLGDAASAAQEHREAALFVTANAGEPRRVALPGIVAFHDGGFSAAHRGDDGVVVRWLTTSHAPVATVSLRGAQSARVHAAGSHVACADDRGRLILLDLADGRIYGNHRIRL